MPLPPGPPYALIQGRLAGAGVRSDLPQEGAPKVERGYVALIGTGGAAPCRLNPVVTHSLESTWPGFNP